MVGDDAGRWRPERDLPGGGSADLAKQSLAGGGEGDGPDARADGGGIVQARAGASAGDHAARFARGRAVCGHQEVLRPGSWSAGGTGELLGRVRVDALGRV